MNNNQDANQDEDDLSVDQDSSSDLDAISSAKEPPPRPPAARTVRPPTTIEFAASIPRTPLKDKYEFLTVLGAGGAGVIYKARQQPLGRLVAVKMIHSHLMTPIAVKRFHQEAKTISTLAHQNIIAVYDFGISDENQPFMIMDYAEGTPLSDILNDVGTLPVEMTKTITKQLCDGLAHAHSRGILHRDLKPSNIMMVPTETGQDLVKILDFGLAKIFVEEDTGEQEHLTKTGETVGTPAFMSPEQVMGKALDQTSDLYSLGCVMYHCLTGEPPFVGETKMETMLMHLNSKPEPINPPGGNPIISPYLEAIILRLLDKNPANRFQSMLELKEAIEDVDKGLFVAPPVAVPPLEEERTPQEELQAVPSALTASSVPASGINQLISNRALVVIVLLTGSIAAFVFFLMWLVEYAYPSKTKTAKPKNVASNDLKSIVRGTGEDHYDENTFDDLTFKKRAQDDPKADSISCRHCPEITDHALTYLRGMRKLRRLDLENSEKLTSKGIKELRGLSIQNLILIKSGIDDGIKDSLPHITYDDGTPSLERIDLTDTQVTDQFLSCVPKMTNLKELILNSCKIEDPGVIGMKGSPRLEKLYLSNTKVGDKALETIGTIETLTLLDLSNTNITDAGVKKLAKLTNLEKLILSGNNIGDDSVKSLVPLQKLLQLNLSHTGVTEKCFPDIYKMRLLHLDITDCERITPRQGIELARKMSSSGATVVSGTN